MIVCMFVWIVGHPGLTLENASVKSELRGGSYGVIGNESFDGTDLNEMQRK
jgi:hypothetical protein